MKIKKIRSLSAILLIVPSISFALMDNFNDGLNKVSNTATKTQNDIDNVKNYTTSSGDNIDVKQYAVNKVDEHTNNTVSDTTNTVDNLNKTKNSINDTVTSFSNVLS